jgi:hypothetical protein
MTDHLRALASLTGATLVLALVLAGPPVADAADAPQSPGGSVAAPGLDPAIAERIGELVADVPSLRGLDAAVDVPLRAIDGPTFRSELEALFDEEYPPRHLAAEQAALLRLGLLSEGDDLRALMLELLADQALAYYDPRTRAITLVGDIDEVGPLESLVIVHEYAHALQDQHWDLQGSRVADLSQGDRILAESALIEGEATLVMYEWAAANLSMREIVRVSERALARTDQRLLRRIPPVLRRQLVEFPYLDGYAFVNAVRARGEGWEAVDRAWEDRPVSTEQILHPQRYPSDVPIDVVAPDAAALAGAGWAVAYEQTMGQVLMGVWVADGAEAPSFFGLPGRLPRAGAVEGWGGDRLLSLDGPDGAWAVVWQTAWDSASDATEFAAAARTVLRASDGAHAVLEADVTASLEFPVLVLVADSAATLDGLPLGAGLPEGPLS